MIRINDALAFAMAKGTRIQKNELAAKIWPASSPEAQKVNMSNLISGKSNKINPEWVSIICEETGVDANFLFGMEPMLKVQ